MSELTRNLLLQKFREFYGIDVTEEEITLLWELILDNCEYSGPDPMLNNIGREFLREVILTQKYMEKLKDNLRRMMQCEPIKSLH